MKARAPAIVLFCAFGFTPSLPAQTAQEGYESRRIENPPAAVTSWAEGTIKRISPETGKVTISHGPLPGLDMPPMTMVFRLKNPAWMERMKPGDRIRFQVERQNGALVITGFETRPR